MSKNFKVRDRRNKGWFYMDNDYLNGYAKHFGAIGTAIYVSLCRHANGEQKCYPSQKLIAEELNIGERTVRNYLNLFIKHQLITVEKIRKSGRWLNNVYTLLDKDEWTSPKATVADGTKGSRQHSPKANDDSNQRHVVPTKETNRKNTNIKERKIKSSEERINPIKKEIETMVASFRV